MKNEELRRAQVERQLSGRVNRYVLRWLGYVERMDEEHILKMMNLVVEGNRCRDRVRLDWMDGVKRTLGERGMAVEQGRQNALSGRWDSVEKR